MAVDIAVYVGENGETASLKDRGKIVVFRKIKNKWNVLRERELNPSTSQGMKELRRMMEEVMDFLAECKIFVGLSVTGIPFFELERSRRVVWEMQGKPGDFLDYILARDEEERQLEEQKNETVPPAPVETSAGCYRISIKEIQEKNLGITSKQVLLPFLRQGNFYELRVLCNHIPPWLEAEFLTGKLCSNVNELGTGELEITITKSCCH